MARPPCTRRISESDERESCINVSGLCSGALSSGPTRVATLAFASAGLLHPHVPFDEAANLTLGIAASLHARDKLAVLLFGIAVLFRAKRDNGKKVFDLRKYPLFDDFANLFIAG